MIGLLTQSANVVSIKKIFRSRQTMFRRCLKMSVEFHNNFNHKEQSHMKYMGFNFLGVSGRISPSTTGPNGPDSDPYCQVKNHFKIVGFFLFYLSRKRKFIKFLDTFHRLCINSFDFKHKSRIWL